jgi:hypothetical protein
VSEPEEDEAVPPDDADPATPTPLRLLSLLAIGMVFVLYRPGAEPTLLNTLVLPLLAGLAAWYLTHSLAVLAIGVFFLALAHAEPSSTDLLDGRVYPALTVLAGALLAWILLQRFRSAMADRRAERQAARTRGRSDPEDG